MKDIDLEVYLPSTGEMAVVQIKSETNQTDAEKCVKDMIKHGRDKIFFVYHTGNVKLDKEIEYEGSIASIIEINVDKLSEMILDAGLFNWLLKKVN